MAIESYADNSIPIVPCDQIGHVDDTPFCWNQACDCHGDDEAIAAIYQAVQDGLLTPEEATDLVLGKLL
jgi:hypothetical protein